MNLLPWQQAVIDWLKSDSQVPGILGRNPTNRMVNLATGLRINWGRQAGHTTLAIKILEEFPTSCLVVPSDKMPYNDLGRVPAHLRSRVWVSAPAESYAKYDIMEKEFEPLMSSDIVVVDPACRLSNWEIEPIRAAKWRKYLELSI